MDWKWTSNRVKHLFKNSKVVLIARIILGVVFIYASIDKIINPVDFSNSIDNYHVTPIQLNNLAALIIPWVELIIGVCLIIGLFLNGATLISIFLLIFFIFIITQALVRGIDLHCGCFDLAQKELSDGNLKLEMIKRIIEDFVFLGLAFLIKNNIKD